MAGTVIDLFSCVGGHALGYMRAGFKPAIFCERNPVRLNILKCHFIGYPFDNDIKTFLRNPNSIGLKPFALVGGPPCQKTSVAAAIHGKRTGESLWRYMLDVIRAYPTLEWVIVEQPPGNKEWEAQIQRDLEADGWAVKWITLSAWELGYPHIRRRRFALANRDVQRLESAWQSIPPQIKSCKRTAAARGSWIQRIPGVMRMVDGLSRGLDRQERIEAIGDSNPPEMMEVIFKAIREAVPL